MKRAYACVTVALLLLATGCAGGADAEFTVADNGSSVELQAGDTAVVTLPSNATTGFSWAVTDPGPLVETGEAVYESPTDPGVVGAGGTEEFTFEAEQAGEGELIMEYRRSWETATAAEQTFTLTVTVR